MLRPSCSLSSVCLFMLVQLGYLLTFQRTSKMVNEEDFQLDGLEFVVRTVHSTHRISRLFLLYDHTKLISCLSCSKVLENGLAACFYFSFFEGDRKLQRSLQYYVLTQNITKKPQIMRWWPHNGRVKIANKNHFAGLNINKVLVYT